MNFGLWSGRPFAILTFKEDDLTFKDSLGMSFIAYLVCSRFVSEVFVAWRFEIAPRFRVYQKLSGLREDENSIFHSKQ